MDDAQWIWAWPINLSMVEQWVISRWIIFFIIVWYDFTLSPITWNGCDRREWTSHVTRGLVKFQFVGGIDNIPFCGKYFSLAMSSWVAEINLCQTRGRALEYSIKFVIHRTFLSYHCYVNLLIWYVNKNINGDRTGSLTWLVLNLHWPFLGIKNPIIQRFFTLSSMIMAWNFITV